MTFSFTDLTKSIDLISPNLLHFSQSSNQLARRKEWVPPSPAMLISPVSSVTGSDRYSGQDTAVTSLDIDRIHCHQHILIYCQLSKFVLLLYLLKSTDHLSSIFSMEI